MKTPSSYSTQGRRCVPKWGVPPPGGRIHPDGHRRGVGHQQKEFDDADRIIRQGVWAQANYRRSEMLPGRYSAFTIPEKSQDGEIGYFGILQPLGELLRRTFYVQLWAWDAEAPLLGDLIKNASKFLCHLQLTVFGGCALFGGWYCSGP